MPTQAIMVKMFIFAREMGSQKIPLRAMIGSLCGQNDCSFTYPAEGCEKSFFVLQRLKVHILRKHLVVHSGVKPHQYHICGKTFSQSSSPNVHMRKHHSRIGAAGSREREQLESLLGSSLLEEAAVHIKNLISMNSQPRLGVKSLHLPDTESIIGVEEKVLAETRPGTLQSAPDVVLLQSHHLVTMSTGRHSYEVSHLHHCNIKPLSPEAEVCSQAPALTRH
uniref:C2H2-type domain-containing protein n=1 Tax=Gopherus agassizii TaxID=38772 RepID=A0A452HBN4_9SAUR